MAKETAEGEKFSNINRDDSRKEVFKITKQMKAENCDVVVDKCIKNERKNQRLLMLRNTRHGKNIMKDSLVKSSLGIKKIWS